MERFEAECRFHRAATDGSLGLLEGALLIAAMEADDVDLEACAEEISALETEARVLVDPADPPTASLAHLGLFLGDTVGFCGDDETYHDLANSLLHRVLVRRVGIPVTLAVVWIEIGRRLGLPLVGIGMPMHFLVGVRGHRDLYADPFQRGRVLSGADCAELLTTLSRGTLRLTAEMLRPVSDRRHLFRILFNLRGAHVRAEDDVAALRATSAMIALDGGIPELFRDRGVLALRLGDGTSAAVDLETYLARNPEAEDAESMRALIERAATKRLEVN